MGNIAGAGNKHTWARPAREERDVPKNKRFAIMSLQKLIDNLSRTLQSIEDCKRLDKPRQQFEPGAPPQDWQPTPVADATPVATPMAVTPPVPVASPSSEDELDPEVWEGAGIVHGDDSIKVPEPTCPRKIYQKRATEAKVRHLAWVEHAWRKLQDDIVDYRWFIERDISDTVRLLELHFKTHPFLQMSTTWQKMRGHKALELLPAHLQPGKVRNVGGDDAKEPANDAPVKPSVDAAPGEAREDQAPVTPGVDDTPAEAHEDEAPTMPGAEPGTEAADTEDHSVDAVISDGEWIMLDHTMLCLIESQDNSEKAAFTNLVLGRGLMDAENKFDKTMTRANFEDVREALLQALVRIDRLRVDQPHVVDDIECDLTPAEGVEQPSLAQSHVTNDIECGLAPIDNDASQDGSNENDIVKDIADEMERELIECGLAPIDNDASQDDSNENDIVKDIADEMERELLSAISDVEWNQLQHQIDCLPDTERDDIQHLAERRKLIDEDGDISDQMSRGDFDYLKNAVMEALDRVMRPRRLTHVVMEALESESRQRAHAVVDKPDVTDVTELDEPDLMDDVTEPDVTEPDVTTAVKVDHEPDVTELDELFEEHVDALGAAGKA